MSTRSAIITINPDKTYSGIYCHSDGYPSWNGYLLQTFFNTEESAQALVALGDISAITRDGIAHPYNDDSPAIQAERPSQVAKMIGHDGHIYVFERDHWRHNGDLLTEVLQRPDIQKEIQDFFPTNPSNPPNPSNKTQLTTVSTQHTPAPWFHEQGTKTIRSTATNQWIALIWEPTKYFSADAKLIAAAPDLLHALNLFMLQYDGDCRDRSNRPEIIAARAAIAKATTPQ